ncbi:MAG: hypothetical protein GWN46_05655, partial [Gammaproteobacteria bacterium]|nr:hypothetical protein [Gammaproteobacteria bacterium]
QSELQLGAPDLLFEGPFRNPGGHSYDVDPNGDRFLMLLSKNQETTTTRIPMILNAFELLRGR